jgi:hypothetical protein
VKVKVSQTTLIFLVFTDTGVSVKRHIVPSMRMNSINFVQLSAVKALIFSINVEPQIIN